MAVPQRLLFGIAEDAIKADPEDKGAVLEAYLGRILTFSDPEAHAFQWAAAELRNFVDGIQEVTRFAIAETGLPPDHMGVASDNPASAEAIQASERRMVKNSENKNLVWGDGWEQVMKIGMLVMDDSLDESARRLESVWRNPATPTFAAMADAATKLATAQSPDGRPILHVEQARPRVGLTVEEQKEAERLDKQSAQSQLAELVRPKFQEPGAPNAKGVPKPETEAA